MSRLNQGLVSVLLIICIVGGFFSFWNIRVFLREATHSAIEIRRGIKPISDLAEFESEQLQSERTQKILNANLELGAAAKGTVQAFNRLILPRLAKSLDESQNLLIDARRSTVAIQNLVSNTDTSINQKLLPQATALLTSMTFSADKLGMTLETFNNSLQIISERTGIALDSLTALINSPEWLRALRNVEAGTASLASASSRVDASAELIRKALEKLPELASDIQRITHTASKFKRAVLLIQILSALAPVLKLL